jgi:hypothetical protein
MYYSTNSSRDVHEQKSWYRKHTNRADVNPLSAKLSAIGDNVRILVLTNQVTMPEQAVRLAIAMCQHDMDML